jgi:hypothetical protein
LLPSKDIGELKPWHTVHVDLIGPYTVTAKHQQRAKKIVSTDLKLTCMTFVDPATGWFEIEKFLLMISMRSRQVIKNILIKYLLE